MKLSNLPQILFLIGLFLLPISGGFISNDLTATDQTFSWLGSLFGNADAPMLGVLLPSACFLTAFAMVCLRGKVVQIPFPPVVFALIILAILIMGSNLMSEFRFATYQASNLWMIAILSPIIATSVLGRSTGPTKALAALAAGCTVIAGMGILEYASASDPNWRIFAHWVNPNAAAGMLLFGFLCAIGLTCAMQRTHRIAAAAAALICGIAIFLTQSKGGNYAALVGIVFFSGFGIVFGTSGRTRPIPLLVAIVLLASSFGLGKMIQSASASRANSGAAQIGRLSGGAEAQQSEGFRKLLWKSAISLIRKNPVGSGVGTFRYESTKPGIVPQTHHAHQGFLQLGVEAGVLSLLALAGLAVLFLKESFRGITKLSHEKQMLFGAAMATLMASGFHNFIDSDLQHFGTCVAFFTLLGIVLQLAMDGTTPEYLPANARLSAVGWCGFLFVGLCYFAYVDTLKSIARGAYGEGRFADALKPAETAAALAPMDGEAWAVLARYPANFSSEERRKMLQNAAERSPTMRNYRNLANFENSQNQPNAAISALNKAIQRDPNNLPALISKVRTYDSQGNIEEALQVAKQLISVENSTAYQVRAIPDLIPTETLMAREYVASKSQDQKEQKALLSGALRGYLDYARRTIPQVVDGVKKLGPLYRFAGEGLDDAGAALEAAERVSAKLSALESGTESTDKPLLDEAAAAFKLARESLIGLNR